MESGRENGAALKGKERLGSHHRSAKGEGTRGCWTSKILTKIDTQSSALRYTVSWLSHARGELSAGQSGKAEGVTAGFMTESRACDC